MLVVDDDTVHRMVISRIGVKAGFTIIDAPSFEAAAIAIGGGANFDCITLDLTLGARDGQEVMRLLAKAGNTTPVIVISGADSVVRGEARKFGTGLNINVVDVLPKPVDLANLRSLFDQIRNRFVSGVAA